MTWRHPIGFAALSAVAVILWLHRRRRRVADAIVPSLIPWLALRVAEPLRRRRVPPTVLLALHVGSAVLLGVALAGPERPGRPAQSGDLAVVVDTTLSMAAGDRWPAAKSAVADAIAGASGRVALVALGAMPRVLLAPTVDGAAALRALDRIAPGGVGADVRGALALAAAIAGDGARVRVITDGALDIPPPGGGDVRASTGPPIEWRIVGDASTPPNVAVFGAAASPEPDGATTRLVGSVGNFGPRAVRVTVTLSIGGRTIDTSTSDLAAGAIAPMAWRVDARGGTASIAVESLDAAGAPTADALAADDRAIVPLAPRARRVQVAGPTGPVRRAAAAQSDTRLADVGLGTMVDDGTIDVTVIGGPVPAALPLTGVVLVDPPAGAWSMGDERPISGTWEIAAPHWITAGLDLSDARVGGVRATAAPPWADVLATVDGRPALWAGTQGERRVVVFGFDPALGTLAGRTPFPVLVGRAIAWAAPDMPPPIVAAGSPFALPPWPVAITAPDGRQTLAANRYEGTDLPGLYTLRRAILPRAGQPVAGDLVAVVAGDPVESRLSARTAAALSDALAVPRPSITAAAAPPSTAAGPPQPIQRWWLWAVLLVLAVESIWRSAPTRAPVVRAASGPRQSP
ncbi:MAG: BatA and WFA domain-containing protein [Ardenticatenales bacterium]